jgi:hypothetical protein
VRADALINSASSSASYSSSSGYDELSLSDQIKDVGLGAGLTEQDSPSKIIASTPSELELQYKPMREKVLYIIAEDLKINAALTGFCTGEGSVVTLTVKPDDIKYLYTRQYNIPERVKKDVNDIVAGWVASGRVKVAPDGCRFNSPLLPVPKKDDATGKMSKVRVCIDIRKLNTYLLEDDRFEIPRIPDMLATLAGGTIFGEFDLSDAYGQFRVADDSQQYTAFTWDKQQYVFVGAPFGIKHLPSLFQRFISNLFKDMPFVFAYIDNLCFSSTSWEEHAKHALAIIRRLNSVNLRIKPTSVNLGNYQIKLLGHLITPHGVGMDPDKQKMIISWPRPTTGAGLASFLGLGTYLRDHVRHYADLTAPLEKIKKVAQITWTEQLIHCYETIKRAFATAPFLKFPNFNNRFVIATDASQTGVGGVLYQPDDVDDTITKDNIVAIVSKQLNESQRRYPVYKKELWALVYCLRKFHTFIHGRRNVVVHTDHKPLIHIFKQTQLATALQQWLDVILDYDLIIKYRPGVLHVLPDALSRMYASAYLQESMVWGTHNNIKILDDFNRFSSESDFLCKQSIADAKPIKVVKKRHIIDYIDNNLAIQGSGEGNIKENTSSPSPSSSTSVSAAIVNKFINDGLEPVIISEDEQNEFLLAHTYAPLFACQQEQLPIQLCAIMDIHADRPLTAQQAVDDEQARTELAKKGYLAVPSSLTDEERLLVAQEKRGRIIPDDSIKKQLVEHAHLAGHFGEKAMLVHIDRQGYWWPQLREDITNEILHCTACQRHSITRHGYAPSQSIFSARPCDHYQMDLCQLPVSREGWKFCLVVVDVFTGFIMLEPLSNKEAPTVARALWRICCIIGLPRILQSDNGTEFCNAIIESLCRLTGISRRYIAPYNPRADGKVERSIKTVKQMIVKLFHGTSSMWPLYIPFVQLMYNNKVHELTGATPFSLMFGRVLNEVRARVEPYKPIDLDEWKKHQEKVVSLIYPAINERVKGKQEVYRKKVDALRKKITKDELVPGSLVMIKDPIYLLNPSMRPTAEPLFIGPYTIVRRTLYGPYILRDDTGEIYPRQVPIDQMKILYTPSLIAPEEKKGGDDNIYQVDYIINHSEENGEYQYHVKWKGHDKKDATWEPEENINDPQSIERYFRLLAMKQKIPKRKR